MINNIVQDVHEYVTGFLFTDQNVGNRDIERYLIPAMIKTNKNLQKLMLGHNRISDRGFQTLFPALTLYAPALKILCVGGNRFEKNGIEALSQYLVHPDTKVSTLYLSNLNLHGERMDAVVQALTHNKSVQTLHMVNSGVTGDKVASLLSSNCTISMLHICGNDIGSHGAREIAQVLFSRNTSLQHLCMNMTNMGPEGIKDMADVIQCNTSLISLTLDTTDIVPQEVWDHMARAIQANTTLQTLNIQAELTQQAVETMLKGISGNVGLKNLEISCTDADDGSDVVIDSIDSLSLESFVALGASISPNVTATLRSNKKRIRRAYKQRSSFVQASSDLAVNMTMMFDIAQRMARVLKYI